MISNSKFTVCDSQISCFLLRQGNKKIIKTNAFDDWSNYRGSRDKLQEKKILT